MPELVSYTIQHNFDAPIERVYEAFTTPEHLVRWIWGADAKNPVAEIDLRVGGRFHIECDAMMPEPSRFGDRWAMSGMVARCDAPRHFAYTQHWLAPVGYNDDGMEPIDELVTVTLEPTVKGTRLIYHHAGIPDDGVGARIHKMSVEYTINDLANLLAELG